MMVGSRTIDSIREDSAIVMMNNGTSGNMRMTTPVSLAARKREVVCEEFRSLRRSRMQTTTAMGAGLKRAPVSSSSTTNQESMDGRTSRGRDPSTITQENDATSVLRHDEVESGK